MMNWDFNGWMGTIPSKIMVNRDLTRKAWEEIGELMVTDCHMWACNMAKEYEQQLEKKG